MGVFADSLFTILMSWVRALVNSFWALFTSERTTTLEFLGKNWLMIVVVLIAAGLFIDWIIWLIRWKPYTLWAQRARKVLRIAPQEDEEDGKAQKKEIAAYAQAATQAHALMQEEALDEEPDEDDWLPEQPSLEREDEQAAMQRAQAVPDEELGLYPGMRYDEQASLVQTQELGGTRRLGAVHREGPGAAEVNRRREEIDAYKQELEAAARLERERRMAEMRRAEQERIEREERARQEEEARAAQEEYDRQMQEYAQRRTQYEQELAQYQRDMEAYEAAVAAMQADAEAAQESVTQGLPEEMPEEKNEEKTGRTRVRRRQKTYSELIEGESIEQLPETPQWPQMDETVSRVKKTAEQKTPEKRPEKKNGLVGRMASLIEPEKEEVSGVNALPPRVDPKQAYRPAATPETEAKRRRK